jgi:hypothetical protein
LQTTSQTDETTVVVQDHVNVVVELVPTARPALVAAVSDMITQTGTLVRGKGQVIVQVAEVVVPAVSRNASWVPAKDGVPPAEQPLKAATVIAPPAGATPVA